MSLASVRWSPRIMARDGGPHDRCAPTTSRSDRRKLMVGKGWVQGVALVMVFGFLVMGILAYRTYSASMPLPQRVVAATARCSSPARRSPPGRRSSCAGDCMEYGSVMGHGAYLGPDYTAEYLRLRDRHVGRGSCATPDRRTRARPWSPSCGPTATTRPPGRWCSPTEQVAAFEPIRSHYASYFGTDSTEHGLIPR